MFGKERSKVMNNDMTNQLFLSLNKVLVAKLDGKKPLGRPRRRWEDNIKIDRQEAGCGDMDWIKLVQNRDRWRALVNAVMNLRVP